jgi:hypothetical protein
VDWLSRPKCGDGFLAGEEAKVWQGKDVSEYVTLFSRELESDAFTSLLSGRLLDLYHKSFGHKRKKVGTLLATASYIS